jgi:hypothetical protein
MTREAGLDYAETKPGDRITGTYRRMLTLNSGRFALMPIFAQFHEISVAIKDSMPPLLEALRQVDPTFREIPSQIDGRVATQFVSRNKFKVEFLTPNQWSDD